MKNHFDTHLNVRDLILRYKPRNILELGALDGANTRQILSLRNIYPFRLVTVTTGLLENAFYEVRHAAAADVDFKWVQGLSYEVIPKLPDQSVELCSIDTHHERGTLEKELAALLPKLFPRCIIVFHDTISFPDLRVVIMEFLKEHKDFIRLRETVESAGAMAISRNLVIGYDV